MLFQVETELTYEVHEPSTFIMNLALGAHPSQEIQSESFEVHPTVSVDEYITDEHGNHLHRFRAPNRKITVKYKGSANATYEMEDPKSLASKNPPELPLELLSYVIPSRYCESDKLKRLAAREFGGLERQDLQVQSICNWIHSNIDYVGQSTDSFTSAVDVVTGRVGVCRDFAHLGIALCRALNIPARFVSGYSPQLEPSDFHAVLEVWLDDSWCLFDPTRRISCEEFIRIGTGRDAADVPFANIIGSATLNELSVRCESLSNDSSSHSVESARSLVTVRQR